MKLHSQHHQNCIIYQINHGESLIIHRNDNPAHFQHLVRCLDQLQYIKGTKIALLLVLWKNHGMWITFFHSFHFLSTKHTKNHSYPPT